MAAVRVHLSGAMDGDTSDAALDALLGELDDADAEHTDVAVKHESEWCLSAYGSGMLVWENVEDGEPRHLPHVGRQETRRLLRLVAAGDFDALEGLDWRLGPP